uniref:Uncharacterized protein n=1 Tax=Meloidogyne incognita TaxID=6306 RepID=A0A914LAG8_MELIC
MRVRRRLLRLAHLFHCDVAKFGRFPLWKVVGTLSTPILDVLAELNDHLKLILPRNCFLQPLSKSGRPSCPEVLGYKSLEKAHRLRAMHECSLSRRLFSRRPANGPAASHPHSDSGPKPRSPLD